MTFAKFFGAKFAGRIAAICAVTLGLTACGINAVPTQDEQVKAAWSQVQNEYQRRADLIPQPGQHGEGLTPSRKRPCCARSSRRAPMRRR